MVKARFTDGTQFSDGTTFADALPIAAGVASGTAAASAFGAAVVDAVGASDAGALATGEGAEAAVAEASGTAAGTSVAAADGAAVTNAAGQAASAATVDGLSATPTVERLPPDAVLAASNLQDTLANSPPTRLADIDEDTAIDDGEWWTAVDPTVAIEVRLGFPAPGNPLSGTQRFKARLRKTAGAPDPTVDVILFEDGAPVRTLLSGVPITADDPGEVIIGEFNAVEIASVADAEIRIVSTPGTG